LDLLDEGELSAIEEFFLEAQGAFGSFAFTDPEDGTEYADCSVEGDRLSLESVGEMRGRTELTLRENRR
jgi:hypothetical protein